MRDEHPRFAVFVVPKIAEAAIHSATTECADGFVEKTTAVLNDAARFDVFKRDFHFANGSPNPYAFFIDD